MIRIGFHNLGEEIETLARKGFYPTYFCLARFSRRGAFVFALLALLEASSLAS
jgi:hypothetical protein